MQEQGVALQKVSSEPLPASVCSPESLTVREQYMSFLAMHLENQRSQKPSLVFRKGRPAMWNSKGQSFGPEYYRKESINSGSFIERLTPPLG